MAEGLNYKVGLDAKGFQAGVQQVTTGFNQIEASSKKATTAIVQATKNVPATLNNIKQPAANAGAALFSLSQVTRDLPFGFIAIQNNLPQVVDSFSALSKQSGGVMNALKGLGGALLGPAGIGFAFSAITSGITALIQKYGSLGAGLNAVLGLTSAATRAQMALNKATDEAAASVVGETSKVNQLTATLANNNASQQQRKNAYETLKKEYPGIIQNMSFENSLTAKGAELIKSRSAELIKYIQLKGKEAALVKLLEEASLKEIQARRKFREEATGENQTFLDRTLSALNDVAFGAGNSLKTLAKETQGANREAGSYASALEEVRNQLNSLNRDVVDPEKTKAGGAGKIDADELLKARIQLLEAQIELEKDNALKVFAIRKDLLDAQETLALRSAAREIKGAEARTTALLAIEKEFQAKRKGLLTPVQGVEVGKELSGVLKGTEAEFQKLAERIGLNIKAPLTITVDTSNIKNNLATAAQILEAEWRFLNEQFSETAKQILSESLTESLSGVGEVLGNFLGGDGFKGIQKIFNTLGNTLVQVGKYAIQTGVQMEAFKKAFKVLFATPAAAIAAGIGLVALGTLVKNKFASGGVGLAEGGIVPPGFPNDSFPARLTSNEAVIPLDRINSIVGQLNGMGGTLQTAVSGNDLLFILNRAERRQGRGY